MKKESPLDLTLSRLVRAPRHLVWRAWTDPDLLRQWFCPQPWRVDTCEIDLRPGGRFGTAFRGPAGESFDNLGVWLEVVPEERLVFTDALLPGWRPSPAPFMTAIVTFADEGAGTRYTATALHATTESRTRHESMGIHDGWGRAAEQMEALARALAGEGLHVALEGETGLRITRRFAAPRARVFAAFLDPALVRQWLWARDHRMTECASDGRPGGRYRYVW